MKLVKTTWNLKIKRTLLCVCANHAFLKVDSLQFTLNIEWPVPIKVRSLKKFKFLLNFELGEDLQSWLVMECTQLWSTNMKKWVEDDSGQ